MFLLIYSDVPRGTLQFMKLRYLMLFFLLLTACEKPDPNPELKDPVYSDIAAQLDVVSKAAESEKKNLEGHEKDLASVTPQTGEIKTVQKKISDTLALINRWEQERSYLQLRLASRKKEDFLSYNKAFVEKKQWPDPEEYKAYKENQKLRTAKRSWDVKERMRQLGIKSGTSKTAGGAGAEGGHAGGEKKAEHGGGH